MIVVRQKIREAIQNYDNLSVARDLPSKLDVVVAELLRKACERAKANNRRTVMARDI